MFYNFKASFDRCFKKLSSQKQKCVFDAIESLKVFYETRKISQGLGLKYLRKNYWEIRASLQDRIIFSLENDKVSFILVGSHDDVRKFLKNL